MKMNETYTVTSEFVKIEGNSICMHTWSKRDTNTISNNSLVIIYHGFLAHGQYPTVSIAAEKLANEGYTIMAPDMPNHGQSPGIKKGYLPSPDELINLGISISKWCYKHHLAKINQGSSKLFLLGSSMGGLIALSICHKLAQSKDDNDIELGGVILLAPMLKLSIDTPTSYALSALNTFISTWEVIPSSSTNSEKQYRDPVKRKLCEEDKYANKSGKICVGSAYTCVELANNIGTEFSSMNDFSFLVLVADEDVVIDNQGSVDLMNMSQSKDKTLKRYPALHGLLCEPSPLVDTILNDIIQWMNERNSE